jgi:hypothetical protein
MRLRTIPSLLALTLSSSGLILGPCPSTALGGTQRQRPKTSDNLEVPPDFPTDQEPPPSDESSRSRSQPKRWQTFFYLRPHVGVYSWAVSSASDLTSRNLFTFGGELGFSIGGKLDLGLNYSEASFSQAYAAGISSYRETLTLRNLLVSLTYSGGILLFGGRLGISYYGGRVSYTNAPAIYGPPFSGNYYKETDYLFMSAPVVGVRIPLGSAGSSLDLEASAPCHFGGERPLHGLTASVEGLAALKLRI